MVKYSRMLRKFMMCLFLVAIGLFVNLAIDTSSAYGVDYYTSSHVSNRNNIDASTDAGNYKTTGEQKVGNGGGAKTETAAINVSVGDTVNITFSHNVYANTSVEGVSWEVRRNVTIDGVEKGGGFLNNDYTLVTEKSELSSGDAGSTTGGTTNITDSHRQDKDWKYIGKKGKDRKYHDSSTNNPDYFLLRDYYEVTFNNPGVYKFCETIYIEGVEGTTACSQVNVSDGFNECEQWKPESYTKSNEESGATSVLSKVQNATLGTGWGDSVYAKPKDNIKWIHCYYPGVQKVAYSVATKTHASESIYLSDGSTTENTNVYMKDLYSWGNSFTIESTSLRNPDSLSTGNYRNGTLDLTKFNGGNYVIGNSDIKYLIDGLYIVEYGSGKNKAGKTLVETNTSSMPTAASINNHGVHTWDCNYESNCSKCGSRECNCTTTCTGEGEEQSCTRSCETCCNQCAWGSCSHSNDFITHSCSGTASDHADVLVPYNFTNTSNVSIKQTVAYAGETISVNATFTVHPRYNRVTGGIYATNVDNAETRLVAYTSNSNSGSANSSYGGGDLCGAIRSSLITHGNCGVTSAGELDELNSIGSLNGITESDFGGNYNVFDVPAGEYYCVVAAVYPANSGYDTNMNASGSNSWYISAPSCVKVAKKPSLQVWGNSLYTASTLTLNPGVKGVIDGVYGWTGSSRDNATVFGSWVEHSIVANGLIYGIASGASTGDPGDTVRTKNNLGGSWEGNSVSLCIRSPLTMPNSGCNSNSEFKPGGTTGSMNAPSDREKLVARFANENITNAGVDYEGGVTNIDAMRVDKGKTIVKVGDSDITIRGDIIYDSSDLVSLTDIPKMVIYAKGDINIMCSVEQIDAVLIANGNVNTCSDGGSDTESYNLEIRSNRLKINGAVITNKMTAGRTYGAATGVYSTEPAEIVNYDTSLYLWGAPRSDASSSGKLDTVYLKELSPRY